MIRKIQAATAKSGTSHSMDHSTSDFNFIVISTAKSMTTSPADLRARLQQLSRKEGTWQSSFINFVEVGY
jgi:hypothetical protein